MKYLQATIHDQYGTAELLKLTSYLNEFYGFIRKTENTLAQDIQQLNGAELHYYGERKKELDNQIARVWLFSIVALILGIFCLWIAIIYITKIADTIVKISHLAHSIADGDLLVHSMELQSQDERAILVQSFNKMAENLRSIIDNINSHASLVTDASGQLKENAVQSARFSEDIAHTIQQVSQGAAEQAVESQRTLEATESQTVLQNIDQMLVVAEKADQAAQDGKDKVIGFIDQITQIETKMASIQSVTDLLKKRSTEIEDILQLINQIVEQINLLSLNASIEAARAGEYGRGFAVVADEVRKLAESSTSAVNNISTLLQAISHDSKEVDKNIWDGVAEITTGAEMAREARNAFEKIVDTSQRMIFKYKRSAT
jgi:methyl-accepting chemotaxis protein